VEIKPLAEMLEDMLYESDDAGFEVRLAEASGLRPEEWDAVQAEYRERYARAVDAVCSLRGEPIFAGDPATEESLSWLDAGEACVWHDPGGELYVAWSMTSEGAHVLAGGRPLQREPNAITVMPPGD
jgi:hypothetical protein